MKTIRILVMIWALAFAWAAPAHQQPDPSQIPLAAAPDYAQDSAWLCLPGRKDACSAPMGTAALDPKGYGPVGQAVPAANPPVDCFYVYPTISHDPGFNSDLVPAEGEEKLVAINQFARFGAVCRTFAPMYRQVSLRAQSPDANAQARKTSNEIAYSDLLAAWRNFLSSRNNDRPFVIIGHSQGGKHGIRLVKEEIDGKPVAKRMLSAILLGWTVEVPQGKLVGGTFKSLPLCTSEGETGCVLTWMSYRAEHPPVPNSHFGWAPTPGMTAGCTNPAALGSNRAAKLESYWMTSIPPQQGEQPIVWSTQGPPPAPFLRTRGLVTGACVHDGQAGYFAVRVDADPNDALTDRIPGDVYANGRINADWGLHFVDTNIAQGDLLRLVQAQARTFERTKQRH